MARVVIPLRRSIYFLVSDAYLIEVCFAYRLPCACRHDKRRKKIMIEPKSAIVPIRIWLYYGRC